MECRRETTLEDLLAEPIVLRLMERDGVSIDEARSLYDKVTLRRRKQRRRTASKSARAHVAGSRTRPSPSHAAPCM
jgi:hypothetical protein